MTSTDAVPDLTAAGRPLYRVGLYVEMDAEGGDYIDAAMAVFAIGGWL